MKRVAAVIPSLLSSFRLIFAAIFPFCPEQYWIFLVLAAAASDGLDGWLARRWHVESWSGGLLDAIADKVFSFVVLFVFVYVGKFSLLWIPLIIARDVTVAVTAAYAASFREWDSFRHMDARMLGKLATAGLFALFTLVLLAPQLTLFTLIVASFCSVLAAGDYGLLFYKGLQEYRAAQ